MITTIIFDIGNVLFEWNPIKLTKKFVPDPKEAERLCNAVFLCQEWRNGDMGIYGREGTVRAVLEKFPDDAEIIKILYAHADEVLTENKANIPFIKKLKEAGFDLYFLSNTNPDDFAHIEATSEIIRYMTGGIASYKIKLVKPDPAIYEYFLKNFNKKAEECLFIDDSELNAGSAAGVGMKTICLRNMDDLQSEILKFSEIKEKLEK